jgi:CubicO group peptidase (beta-lactamase class C family)
MLPESPTLEADRQLEGFADFVHATMAVWKVPGLAVAVVKDGQITFSRGFGLRDVQGVATVTPQTLFAIGSCTKAFTSTGLAILADEGKLDWDAPVRT